jgi:two-component system chemotaxis response regulator CheB
MSKLRVLIIDDAVVIRRLVSDCLAGHPDIEVVGTAANGRIGLAKIPQLNPDIVTLDIEMPELDGLQTLDILRKEFPRLPVIMFSTLTERGASATFEAMSRGASDYVTKPANVGGVTAALMAVRDELVPKIIALCRRPIPQPAPGLPLAQPCPKVAPRTHRAAPVGVLAIGVSTGGPNALATLMPALCRNLRVPVVLVQHMPPLFTRLLAERLEAVTGFPTREGQDGALVRPGEVWIAPGGFHLEVVRSGDCVKLRTHQGPPENSCRPAVDVLFRSVAQAYGSGTLAVVLTGMGQDGLKGCAEIRAAGGQVLAQDEATSVVWGMPGAVSHAGLADRVLPLGEIAAEINRRVQNDLAQTGGTPTLRALALHG